MSKEKIRKALKNIGLAGIIAGIGLISSGCNNKASASCGKGFCGSKSSSVEKSTSSCGKGSCGKGSCG